jgi:penicillin amidase
VALFEDFKSLVFDDEYSKAPQPVQPPAESTLLEAVLKDSSFKFLDNINTAKKETLGDITLAAFRQTAAHLRSVESEGQLEWGKNKDTHVSHLLKIPEFSRLHLPIGGGSNVINATRGDHGPSWRMVVSLTAKTEAYGVYPGGQSGNPGSRFYDNFINYWIEGKYYPLWMMTKDETGDARIKWKMKFSKS